MKKLLLPLLLIITTASFSQDNTVKYFGGIYNDTLYFNWVMHNKDSCYYIVELSDNGYEYYEVERDSIHPVPVAVMHGFKIPACSSELCIRLIAKMSGVVFEYQPETFKEGVYTYVADIKPRKGKAIHASF